jgi:hypothetical protein
MQQTTKIAYYYTGRDLHCTRRLCLVILSLSLVSNTLHTFKHTECRPDLIKSSRGLGRVWNLGSKVCGDSAARANYLPDIAPSFVLRQ